jgi:hypothetical protein
MKAYKVFNNDWTCRGFQYKVGETYIHDGEIKLCRSGFHACVEAVDCFNYYDFNPDNKVAEVELGGAILSDGGDKHVASEITLLREVSWEELLSLVNVGKGNSGYANSGNRNSGNRNSGYANSGYANSGDRNSGNMNSGYANSGDSNSGHMNSGNRNSGHYNSGNMNSGNRNSGHWNSGNSNSGYFNTGTPSEVRVFNRDCDRGVWEAADRPDFIYKVTVVKVVDGLSVNVGYKEAWAEAYAEATDNDIELLKALPNFDAAIFEEITGIDVTKERT